MKNAIPKFSIGSVIVALGLTSPAAAQGSFLELGPGTAYSVSDDGKVIAGYDSLGVFRWTALGAQSLGMPPAFANDPRTVAMSANGDIIAATIEWPTTAFSMSQGAGLWSSAGGWQFLGGFAPTTASPNVSCGNHFSSAFDISADGSRVAGYGLRGCTSRPMVWGASFGMVEFETTGSSGRANAVSGNGALLGGRDGDGQGHYRAALFLPGGPSILMIPASASNPFREGEVWGMNHDGTVVVGSEKRGPAWKVAGGSFQSLGIHPMAVVGVDTAEARATNADGSMIVGHSGSNGTRTRPFIWTKEDGMMDLEAFLGTQGITVPAGYTLTRAFDMTPTGSHIVGRRGESFFPPGEIAYRIELPAGIKYGNAAAAANTLDLIGTGSNAIGGTLTAKTSNVTGLKTFTFVAAGSARLPLFGGTLLVDLVGPLVTLSATPIGGVSSLNIPIPNLGELVGQSIYLQSMTVVPGSPVRAFFSNGLKVTINR